MLADNLGQKLQQRPEKEELVEKNILRDTNAAPALQEKQKELEKHMVSPVYPREIVAPANVNNEGA